MPENTTHESPAYEKRGYLNHEFRLFHLRGQMDTPVAYHYHDFHKVLILLNGEADYIVEGRSYHLRPLDIVLVGAHCLHKPVAEVSSAATKGFKVSIVCAIVICTACLIGIFQS